MINALDLDERRDIPHLHRSVQEVCVRQVFLSRARSCHAVQHDARKRDCRPCICRCRRLMYYLDVDWRTLRMFVERLHEIYISAMVLIVNCMTSLIYS